MTKEEEIFDVTILGGGPCGLFAAFYAGLRDMRCKIVDSMPALGGRLTAVYPEKHIYDVGGIPKILAKDLVCQLEEQIKPYATTICLNESSENLYRQDDGLWVLETNKQIHKTKTLIIAAGVGSYKPKKHTGRHAEQFEGRGLCYAVLEKNKFKNKNVVVVGGGDSALDWAHEMVSIAASVTLIHRSDTFRAHADAVNKLAKTPINVILNSEITEFRGHDHVQEVVVQHVETKESFVLPTDDVFVMFGFNSSLGKIKEWGLDLSGNGIAVDECMRTNLPGVFAAGDIAKHKAKLDLIATGFAESAIAVAFAKVFIHPKEKPQPLHSTTIMEIKERKANRSNQL